MSTGEGREDQRETGETREVREGVADERSAVHKFLARFFRRRPAASELRARNVLVESPDVDPCLHAQRRAQRRSRAADLLAQRLSVRAPREELVLRGILPPAAPSALAAHGVPREGAVFGLTPAQLAARYPALEGGVPAVLWACAERIVADAGAEGLFRVPGTQREVVELRRLVEAGCAVDVRAASTVHVLTSFVGAFFRALPEPLLGFDLYDGWLALARRTKDATAASVGAAVQDTAVPSASAPAPGPPPETLEAFKGMLRRLPRANYVLLRWLLELLHLITLCRATSRMTARSMGTVFGPTLLRPRVETLETLALTSLHALVVETLVQHYAALFPHDPAEQPPAVLVSTKFPLPAPLVGVYTPPGGHRSQGEGKQDERPAAAAPSAGGGEEERVPDAPSTTPLVPRRPAPAPPGAGSQQHEGATVPAPVAAPVAAPVPAPVKRDVATQTDFPWLHVLYTHLHRAQPVPPPPFPQPTLRPRAPALPQPVVPQRRQAHPPPPRPRPQQHRTYGRGAQHE